MLLTKRGEFVLMAGVLAIALLAVRVLWEVALLANQITYPLAERLALLLS